MSRSKFKTPGDDKITVRVADGFPYRGLATHSEMTNAGDTVAVIKGKGMQEYLSPIPSTGISRGSDWKGWLRDEKRRLKVSGWTDGGNDQAMASASVASWPSLITSSSSQST